MYRNPGPCSPLPFQMIAKEIDLTSRRSLLQRRQQRILLERLYKDASISHAINLRS